MAIRDRQGPMMGSQGESESGGAGGLAKFTQELGDATKSLGNFDKVTEKTTKSLGGAALGVAGAALGKGGVGRRLSKRALKVGGQAVRAAGFDMLNFSTQQLMAGAAGMSVNQAVFSGAKGIASNPTLAKAFGLDLTLKPFMTAGQRTLGITGALARLGVPEADIAEVRGGLFKQFATEEKRAASESKRVDEMVREEYGGSVTGAIKELVEAAGDKSGITGMAEAFGQAAARAFLRHYGMIGGPGGGGGGGGAQ